MGELGWPRRALRAGIPVRLARGVLKRSGELGDSRIRRTLAPELNMLSAQYALVTAALRMHQPGFWTRVWPLRIFAAAAHTADAPDLGPLVDNELSQGGRRRPRRRSPGRRPVARPLDPNQSCILRHDGDELPRRQRDRQRRIEVWPAA